ncbi:hypothetical protein [uncultured Paraglaciecola sp.]|uniref:hypothetical protein n=1 Tax=uncultured Paraglaciecola sp. TaxID=1765024 RepID=UPI0026066D15|nr:hypothetical protein [uncultured Paraglaciecola sp.]
MKFLGIGFYNPRTHSIVGEPTPIKDKIAKTKMQVAFTASFFVLIVYVLGELVLVAANAYWPDLSLKFSVSYANSMENLALMGFTLLLGKASDRADVKDEVRREIESQRFGGGAEIDK